MKPRFVTLTIWFVLAIQPILDVQAQDLPNKHSVRQEAVFVQADFPLPESSALLSELRELSKKLHSELKLLPCKSLIHVYLFENEERYYRFMSARYPLLPRRRAFFIAESRRVGEDERMILTYRSERLRGDLRHELTHAWLHSGLKNVPLWLDEGLAVYYELLSNPRGVDSNYLEPLVRPRQGQAKPNLVRLEELTEIREMTQADYREAWAWVHLLMCGHRQPKALFLQYLQELRAGKPGEPLHVRIRPAFLSMDEALKSHLIDVDAQSRPKTKDKL
jgi:hypothetical protein